MSLPSTVAEVIQKHVTLTVEGIDRMYLNVYVPRLQREKDAAWFFRGHRQQPFASSALMAPMTRAAMRATRTSAPSSRSWPRRSTLA